MKKMLGLFVAVAMLAVCSISVFAEDPVIVLPATALNGDLESYTTTGTNSNYAGQMMTLLVVKDPDGNGEITVNDITDTSIQYIDQGTANEAGVYTFANYIPKETPGIGDVYVVMIGGESIDVPLKTNSINGPDEEPSGDITFAGTISTLGDTTPATIKFLDLTTSEEVAVGEVNPSTGAFSITAPAGDYILKVGKIGHLTFTISKFTLAENPAEGTYSLRAGDVDASGDINIDDITYVLASYATRKDIDVGYVDERDLDESNDINIDDITYALANYGVKASDLDLATN